MARMSAGRVCCLSIVEAVDFPVVICIPAKRGLGNSRTGFTLIELLVVISIVTLLMAILLPALGRARDRAKVVICASNLSQIGLAVVSYTNDNHGAIPRGPACAGPFDFTCAGMASNQLWIGSSNPFHPDQFTGLGVLTEHYARSRKLYFCPADDSSDPETELPRIGTEHDSYGSYIYRQIDYLPESRRRGLISDLGTHVVEGRRVLVEALALDTNSYGPEAMNLRHTNHKGEVVNVLYRDRSVRKFSNRSHCFSLLPETFQSFERIPARLDQILLNADFGYGGPPEAAPKIPTEP